MTGTALVYSVVGALVGYFIGAINPATLIARARGIDLKSSGSGNPGATNASRVLGPRTGLIVGLLDVLKGVIPVLLFTWLGGPVAGDISGLAAVLGHITSPFLRGKGGKGVATTLGVLLAAYPIWLIPVLLAAALVFAITKRMGLSSVAGALALIATALIDHRDLKLSAFGVALGLLVLIRHQANIRAAWTSWRSGPNE